MSELLSFLALALAIARGASCDLHIYTRVCAIFSR